MMLNFLIRWLCSSLEFSTPISSLSKSKRSPSRRSKSRWEPVPETKPVDKPASVTLDYAKYGGWLKFSERDKKVFLVPLPAI